MRTNYMQWRNSISTVQNLVTNLKHDTCLNKKFSIVFFVITDSSGNRNVTQAQIDSSVAKLNRAFKRICVSFQSCSTVVINNYNYNRWKDVSTEPAVKNNWYTDKTINIYMPDSIILPAGAAGYTHPPSATPLTDLIVLNKSTFTNSTSVSIIHEMGHFFGLVHTFDEIGSPVTPGHPPGMTSYEYFDRSNCLTNGDGFCDTEADCYPLTNVTDGKGKYYVIPIDNYMSYYVSTPRCRFTQQQYNFMALVIMTQKLYLH